MRWAVILAGGTGSRFWPLSTPRVPKQLLPLAGAASTAEAAMERLAGLVDPAQILLVTGPALAEPLQRSLGIPAANVLVEPGPKSTGPALVWATHEARRRDPDAVLLSLHADWHVPDRAAFARVAARALDVAAGGDVLVTVGIVPVRPETGYGYIVPGAALPEGNRVARFQEKPNEAQARVLIDQGALWNSGLFAWRAATLLRQVERHTPEIAGSVAALDRGDAAGFFGTCREVSIDVGVFERSADVVVIRGDFSWDDVGNWEALARVRTPDGRGNVLVGPVHAVDSAGVIAWSDGTPVVVAGLSNVVAVSANGRVLVMDRRRAADLKQVLEQLPSDVRGI